MALRLHGNKVDAMHLWLDPVTDKPYEAPSEVDGDKINWVIVCTGTMPDDEDPGDPGRPR